MEWLSAVIKELFSLFVDDVPFSLAIIVWIAAGTLLLPQLILDPGVRGGILFLGFAVVLLVSVLITAMRNTSNGTSIGIIEQG